MSQAGVVNDAALVLPGTVATSYVTSSGTATPSANILNVLGATGSGNTVNVFSPNTILELSDDFIAFSNPAATVGQLCWNLPVGGNVGYAPSTGGHPGLCSIGNAAAGALILSDTTPNNNFVLGSGAITMNFVFNLVTLSVAGNRYVTQLGFTDKADGTTPTNGVYFSYSDNVNSGKWVINCVNGGVLTSTNTTTAAATGFLNFQISINNAGTSVQFFIAGSSVGTIATNIPTPAISPYFAQTRSSGALPGTLIDLFYLQHILTTPR